MGGEALTLRYDIHLCAEHAALVYCLQHDSPSQGAQCEVVECGKPATGAFFVRLTEKRARY